MSHVPPANQAWRRTGFQIPGGGRHDCAAIALVDRLAHPSLRALGTLKTSPCSRSSSVCKPNSTKSAGISHTERYGKTNFQLRHNLARTDTALPVPAYQIPQRSRRASNRARRARGDMVINLGSTVVA